MNRQNNRQLDVLEEFDCNYIFLQLLNFRMWIILSTVLFFLIGTVYSFTAKEVWVSQLKLQEPNQDDQKELYTLNRELIKLIYGFDRFAGENILNEFVKFSANKSSAIKIRKDLDKTFLVELSSDSRESSGTEIIRMMNSLSDQFFKEFLEREFRYIQLKIQDENLLRQSQSQIQLRLNTFLIENYIYRLNYFKTFSGQLLNPDSTHEYINDSIDMLLVYGDHYLNQKHAFISSKDYKVQESQAIDNSLEKVKGMMAKEFNPKAFHIVQEASIPSKLKSPNRPVILILSAVLGFAIGLFGVLLYLSSSPLIHKNEKG